ncbi:aminodeoxychorismate lyase [Neobacillus mesonae]|uniref:aminodeoxychorismate lyase n=1 Tax=Neobacillus mesonae TaxID=1193713 RepID=UPI00203C4352|nr:aminodeoxychorismate lyase [Neobacillus mesonae]MCM3567707.1 aminodeoxychorismate lyase [Neobacillus mesonae]
MKTNRLNSFAAGLLIATAISGAVYIFSDNGSSSKTAVKPAEKQTTVKTELSEAEMKEKLAASGFVVETKADYDKNIAAAKAEGQKASANDANGKKVVYRAVIGVSQGMTSIDVGKMLVKGKIIKGSAFQFSQTVEKKKVENKLRPGTFVVDSDMTTDQVIATIFK